MHLIGHGNDILIIDPDHVPGHYRHLTAIERLHSVSRVKNVRAKVNRSRFIIIRRITIIIGIWIGSIL